jgi:hypothetical protein
MLVGSAAPQALLVVGELNEAIVLVTAEDKTLMELSAIEDWLTALLLAEEEDKANVKLGVLLLTIEDEMAVELVAVDSGEMVASDPAVDELGRFVLLVPPIDADSKMLVASKEDEASATEDDVTVVDDVANRASVTDG